MKNDFEIKPCMLDTKEKCVDFGELCCSTIEERLAFNEYVDQNKLPKELKFDYTVDIDLGGRPIPF